MFRINKNVCYLCEHIKEEVNRMLPKHFRSAISFSLSFLLLLASSTFAWTGKVVGVSDGDTIKVLHDGKQVKIRLYGVDTPEKAQAWGQKAKKFTASFVAGRIVDIEPVATDRYGRTVALVYVDGRLLQTELVSSGSAWVYRNYCKRQPLCGNLIALEAQARESRIGLWSDPHAQPPWEWRRGKKSGKKPRDISGVYHGNTKSHIFHRPGCRHYNCKNCTRSFPDRDSALKAGYRPCGQCNP